MPSYWEMREHYGEEAWSSHHTVHVRLPVPRGPGHTELAERPRHTARARVTVTRDPGHTGTTASADPQEFVEEEPPAAGLPDLCWEYGVLALGSDQLLGQPGDSDPAPAS